MIIKKGEDRIAFVGEKLTVKLAKTSPRKAYGRAEELIKRYGIKALLNEWAKYGADDQQTLPHRLLHGLAANNRERRLAKNFGRIVVPTVSILGGIANIQRTAEPVNLPQREIQSIFAENLGGLLVAELSHNLEDTTNLGMSDGRVRFIDGGSRRLEGLLESSAEDVEMSLASVATAVGPT